jgi:hypothetical protein
LTVADFFHEHPVAGAVLGLWWASLAAVLVVLVREAP